MKFEWIYRNKQSQRLRDFLNERGLSRSQLKKMKFHGRNLFVNHHYRLTNYYLHYGNVVTMVLSDEAPAPSLVPSNVPLKVIYEDNHFLVVDKPFGVDSIPSVQHPTDTMANRVKGYLIRNRHSRGAVHIIGRLDRNTSGLMLFAKHGYAHSLIDQQRHTGQLQKFYTALVSQPFGAIQHGWINLPLQPSREFYMRGEARVGGKTSISEYWVQRQWYHAAQVRVKILTGRTHQIRIHFASIGHPLLGDDLYFGPQTLIQRQALHCSELRFYHPFLQREVCFRSPLPSDLRKLINNLNNNEN